MKKLSEAFSNLCLVLAIYGGVVRMLGKTWLSFAQGLSFIVLTVCSIIVITIARKQR